MRKQSEIVAKYEYDAWGNTRVLNEYGYEEENSSFIGNVNPFRYRGYYYDTETGFYYLQTRYYDPSIMRFINADNYELVATLSSSHELNLYAYCGNNPVMYTDETGEGFFLVACLVGVIVGATFGAVDAAASGENILASAIIYGVAGGLTGAISALSGSFAVQFGVNTLINFTANTANDYFNNKNIAWQDNFLNAGISAGLSSFINTQAIGLITNKVFANIADESLVNIFQLTLEQIATNLSRQKTKYSYYSFGFNIGIPSY